MIVVKDIICESWTSTSRLKHFLFPDLELKKGPEVWKRLNKPSQTFLSAGAPVTFSRSVYHRKRMMNQE
jgi:hypothetical protein